MKCVPSNRPLGRAVSLPARINDPSASNNRHRYERLPTQRYESSLPRFRHLPLNSHIVIGFEFPSNYLTKNKHGQFYTILQTSKYRQTVADNEGFIVGFFDGPYLCGIYEDTEDHVRVRVKLDEVLAIPLKMKQIDIDELFIEHQAYDRPSQIYRYTVQRRQ